MRNLALLLLIAVSCNAFGQEELRSVGEHINYLHQREWVRLSPEGTIAGRLLILNEEGRVEERVGAKVVVSRDGKAVLETMADEGGKFTLAGLEPGAYAIQARGSYTMAACALHVMPSNAEHLTSDLEIFASVIAKDRAAQLLSSDLVPADLQASSDTYYRSHQQDPLAGERKFNSSHKVVLRNGTLVGRVSRPGWSFGEQDLTGTVAQIVRDGVVVAKTAVGEDGYFEFPNVVPGVYDLFVNGDDGLAVLAFEAVAGSDSLAVSSSDIRMVSTRLGMFADCLCCEMIQASEINACSTCDPIVAPAPIIEEVVSIADPCGLPVDSCGCDMAPLCGGGYAGGGFHRGGGGGGFGGGGGGYGGGGLGGIGGLLGVAGLAVGVAALADDDDGGFNVNLATPIN